MVGLRSLSPIGVVIVDAAVGVFRWNVGIILGADIGPRVPEMAGQALRQQRAVARFQRLNDRFMLVYSLMPKCVFLVRTVPDAIHTGVELVVRFNQHRIAAGADDALMYLLIELEISQPVLSAKGGQHFKVQCSNFRDLFVRRAFGCKVSAKRLKGT